MIIERIAATPDLESLPPGPQRSWELGEHSIFIEYLEREGNELVMRFVWGFPYRRQDPGIDVDAVANGVRVAGKLQWISGSGGMGILQTILRCSFALPENMGRLHSLSLLVSIDDERFTLDILQPK